MLLVFSGPAAAQADEQEENEQQEFPQEDKILLPQNYFPTYRESAKVLSLKAYEVQVLSKYFSTSGTYSHEGNEVELPEGSSFTRWDTDINVLYGYGRQLEFRFGGRFRQLTSESSTASLNNSGVESGWVGLKYAFPEQGKVKYALDIQGGQTAYSNSTFPPGQAPADNLILGDDGFSFMLGAHMAYSLALNNVWSASAFYHAPPNSLSPEIVYDTHMAWPYRRVAFLLGLKGIETLGADEFASSPATKPSMSTGVTAQFNSINRRVLMPYAGLNFSFQSWRVELSAAQTILGQSTDQGMEIGLGIVWNTIGKTSTHLKIDEFKEYAVEATVLKVSPRGKFLKVDKGLAHDLEKGHKVDIYQSDFFGGNKLVAAGHVFEVKTDSAIIRVTTRYRKIPIKKGFVVRADLARQ